MPALPRNLAHVSSETVSVESFRRDVHIIGVVGAAHAFSHFFQLSLAPLFPLPRAEFDVSWTVLGLLVGIIYAAGVTQFAAGFVVDRAGGRPVLLSGLDLGAVLCPAWFGLMLDQGLARRMFYLVSILLMVAVATVLQVRRTNTLSQPTWE